MSVTIVPPAAVTVSMSFDRASRSSWSAVCGSTADVLTGVGVLRHHQLMVGLVVREVEVDGRVVDGDPQLGFVGDVGDAPPPVIDLTAVLQGLSILVGRAQAHLVPFRWSGPGERIVGPMQGVNRDAVSAWLTAHVDGAVAPFTFESSPAGIRISRSRSREPTGGAWCCADLRSAMSSPAPTTWVANTESSLPSPARRFPLLPRSVTATTSRSTARLLRDGFRRCVRRRDQATARAVFSSPLDATQASHSPRPSRRSTLSIQTPSALATSVARRVTSSVS